MAKYKERKRIQRKVNKIIRNLNKALENDTLWRGRFEMHQNATNWFEYEDHSGGTMSVMVTMRDKKTGRTHMDSFWAGSHAIKYPYPDFISFDVSNMMNDFIVEKCDVWHEDVSPYDDTTDYRKIK